MHNWRPSNKKSCKSDRRPCPRAQQAYALIWASGMPLQFGPIAGPIISLKMGYSWQIQNSAAPGQSMWRLSWMAMAVGQQSVKCRGFLGIAQVRAECAKWWQPALKTALSI